MFGALLTRDDVVYLAGSFVAHLGPGINASVLPLHRTGPSVHAPAARDLRTRVLNRVDTILWPARSDFQARRENLATLRRAADVITQGGGVHLFPTGSMSAAAAWQPGIGHLARLLAHRPSQDGRPVYLVPLVYGVSDAHVEASRIFPRRSLTRLAGRLQVGLLAGPPYVYAPPPVDLSDLDITPRTPAPVITRMLFEVWEQARADAERTFARWPNLAPHLQPHGAGS
jgi:hypothetical protein